MIREISVTNRRGDGEDCNLVEVAELMSGGSYGTADKNKGILVW